MNGKCSHCGEFLPRHSTVRRKFCNDVCRVAFHRGLNKGDKLEMLMAENQSICDQLDVQLQNARLNRDVKNAWFAIDDLRQRNREIIRQIANLVAK